MYILMCHFCFRVEWNDTGMSNTMSEDTRESMKNGEMETSKKVIKDVARNLHKSRPRKAYLCKVSEKLSCVTVRYE